MKNLQEYIEESLLDDEDDLLNSIDDSIVDSIKQYLENNYVGSEKCKISGPDKDGKYVVDCESNLIVRNHSISQLTNGMFKFRRVKGKFACDDSIITSLEGAPEIVDYTFSCSYCGSLTSLEGAPEKVGGDFDCSYCFKLKTLKGAPKEVGGYFNCRYCDKLTSLEGAPKEVGGGFVCADCKSLTSLKGAPKKVGSDFYCVGCKAEFTKDDVTAVSKVKNNIYC